MSGLTLGMNPDEVEATGRELQRRADEIRAQVGATDRSVSSLPWRGRDAERFKTQWWPEHRGRLLAAADDLHGLGQSALNNASEQRQKSGGGTGITPPTVGGGIAGPGDGAPGPGTDSRAIGSGTGAGMVPDWFVPDPNREYAYQCVDWVKKRRANLGLSTQPGNGWELAANNHGTVDTDPTFGSIASYGDASDYGHTMVVEDVLDGGKRIRVSEMNTGIDGSSAYVGNPEEFRSDRIFEWTPSGWVCNGRNVGMITFAN